MVFLVLALCLDLLRQFGFGLADVTRLLIRLALFLLLLLWLGYGCLHEMLLKDRAIERGVKDLHNVGVAALRKDVDFREQELKALLFVHHLLNSHDLNGNLLVCLKVNCQFYSIFHKKLEII